LLSSEKQRSTYLVKVGSRVFGECNNRTRRFGGRGERLVGELDACMLRGFSIRLGVLRGCEMEKACRAEQTGEWNESQKPSISERNKRRKTNVAIALRVVRRKQLDVDFVVVVVVCAGWRAYESRGT
jgi:hypothetical protein